MASAVCTLFEGDYHKGVAVLINSLYKNGFHGDFYAGYRGTLPQWAQQATANPDSNWPGAKLLQLAKGLRVHFLPIISDYHLAHYKPNFMLCLLKGLVKDAEALAYFDPDIVNLCKWGFYEKWMSCGVAMVHEIVSNDMPATHPNRMEWYNVIKLLNKQPKREIKSYINSGFCGISAKNIEFLNVWSQIIEVAIKEYDMDATTFIAFDRTSAFYCIDQDAFNIAAMCCESPVSEMGPEAMDFVGAGWTMSHATGWPKPWRKKFILSALAGSPPSRQDKHHWNNVESPISLYKAYYLKTTRVKIAAATLIGRFYSRN
jgi:hypothetical protein